MRKARATTLSTSTPPRRGGRKAAYAARVDGDIDPYEWGGKSHCTCRGGLYIRPRAPAFSASLLQNATRHGRIYNAPLHAKSMVHRIVGAAICRPAAFGRYADGRAMRAPTGCAAMIHRTRRAACPHAAAMSRGVSDSFVGAAISRPRVNRRSTPTECTPLRRTRRAACPHAAADVARCFGFIRRGGY